METGNATTVFNLIYAIGMGLWLVAWHFAGGFTATKKNKFLWVPFFFVLFVLMMQIILWYSRVQVTNFAIEQSLVKVVETNSQKLIQAIIGTLIIASILSSLKGTSILSHDFLVFESLALIFVVVGVLPIYWIPSEKLEWLFLLRHFKTVPYVYCIGFFLAGVLVLLQDLFSSNDPSPKEDHKDDHTVIHGADAAH